MSWLKEIRVPIVELDCSCSKEDVWQQLMAIGRLVRPAVCQITDSTTTSAAAAAADKQCRNRKFGSPARATTGTSNAAKTGAGCSRRRPALVRLRYCFVEMCILSRVRYNILADITIVDIYTNEGVCSKTMQPAWQ